MHRRSHMTSMRASNVMRMPETWRDRPTPASQLIARALEDNPGWKQQSVAHATGLDAALISRWYVGGTNPPERKVAIAARALGYDPGEFGITDPRALSEVAHSTGPAPEWARDLGRKLDHIIDLLEHNR